MDRLTNKEEEVMQVLWELEKAFVKEVLAKLPKDNHYNTVSTIIRNLEEKGYVSHVAFGKNASVLSPRLVKRRTRKAL